MTPGDVTTVVGRRGRAATTGSRPTPSASGAGWAIAAGASAVRGRPRRRAQHRGSRRRRGSLSARADLRAGVGRRRVARRRGHAALGADSFAPRRRTGCVALGRRRRRARRVRDSPARHRARSDHRVLRRRRRRGVGRHRDVRGTGTVGSRRDRLRARFARACGGHSRPHWCGSPCRAPRPASRRRNPTPGFSSRSPSRFATSPATAGRRQGGRDLREEIPAPHRRAGPHAHPADRDRGDATTRAIRRSLGVPNSRNGVSRSRSSSSSAFWSTSTSATRAYNSLDEVVPHELSHLLLRQRVPRRAVADLVLGRTRAVAGARVVAGRRAGRLMQEVWTGTAPRLDEVSARYPGDESQRRTPIASRTPPSRSCSTRVGIRQAARVSRRGGEEPELRSRRFASYWGFRSTDYAAYFQDDIDEAYRTNALAFQDRAAVGFAAVVFIAVLVRQGIKRRRKYAQMEE